MTFSTRKGFLPARKTLQLDGVDQELRNRLWSILQIFVWDSWAVSDQYRPKTKATKLVDLVITKMWLHYFKQPYDTLAPFKHDYGGEAFYPFLRNAFLQGEWWRVYDIIELTLAELPTEQLEQTSQALNNILEDENSGYRISGIVVAEITDDNELNAIDDARNIPFREIRAHLEHLQSICSVYPQ